MEVIINILIQGKIQLEATQKVHEGLILGILFAPSLKVILYIWSVFKS